jgi:hypothetical protein
MGPGPTADHHPAVRAAITAEKNRTGETKKPGGNKAMAPETTTTPGAAGRPGPKKISSLGKYLLDVNGNQEYQMLTPCRDCYPCREGVGSFCFKLFTLPFYNIDALHIICITTPLCQPSAGKNPLFTSNVPGNQQPGFKHIYRIREGSYRIIYQVLDERLIIYVLHVGDRKDVYKNLLDLVRSRYVDPSS